MSGPSVPGGQGANTPLPYFGCLRSKRSSIFLRPPKDFWTFRRPWCLYAWCIMYCKCNVILSKKRSKCYDVFNMTHFILCSHLSNILEVKPTDFEKSYWSGSMSGFIKIFVPALSYFGRIPSTAFIVPTK